MGRTVRADLTRRRTNRHLVALTLGLTLCALLATPAMAFGLGSLSGTVTAANGGRPLDGVEVCAESVGVTDIRACVATASDGKYRIEGLEAVNYKVEFRPGALSGFLSQYYNGKATSAEADLVKVVDAADIFGIDAALQEDLFEGGGAEAGAGTPVVLPLPATAPAGEAAPQPVRKACRKGWRKVRVRGKQVCRKIQRKNQARAGARR